MLPEALTAEGGGLPGYGGAHFEGSSLRFLQFKFQSSDTEEQDKSVRKRRSVHLGARELSDYNNISEIIWIFVSPDDQTSITTV